MNFKKLNKKKLLKYTGIFLLVFSALAIWQRELIAYGFLQLNGQLEVMNNGRRFEELKKDSNFPDSLKAKIKIIEEARKFGMEKLGMTFSKNYTKIYDQKGAAILWNVSAAYPYKLKAYKWKFPIVGTFSYKGYFDLEKAKKERDRLKNNGEKGIKFDTNIRSVSAWSTLGWFEDVLLSNNLNRSEGNLVELILHELTHATLYVKDSVEFNENLANFIGEEGAKLFLEEKYGKNSKELNDYIFSLQDSKKYRNFMLLASTSLDLLYNSASFIGKNSDIEKEKTKQNYLNLIKSKIDTVSFSNKNWSKRFQKRELNNTNFMSVRRYNSSQDTLKVMFEEDFNKDLKAFLKYFADKYPSL
ncbi:putative aminopeptidase [Bernardetia litoralis DSM 6794]|uniref:Putative aminopeptidase n=1 Tax=Bernardetia litoralis (strain ATCC 23117 / DSM 6794 / NBRC 15988 / NCIMB 1366 / Fx l1 / Sio-4) TaxID=880071 RepID=I4ANE9_BERLS|nr:aminopeptidase [Bernardetia litoralis]AFM05484.1 putative aminopeptidase [Bernardetia litoralis DSM 6794]